MKKHILTLLFLLLGFLSYSQRFEKVYASPGSDYGVDIAYLSDQSIVTVGTSNSYGNGGDDIVLTKTDASGNLLWSRYFGGVYNDRGKSIVVSANDDIYVCGVLMGSAIGTEDIQLTKVTKDGAVVWTKTYGGTASDVVNDVVIKNNKVYMIGTTKSYGAGQEDIYFISTDTAGIVITSKTIGTSSRDFGNCITKSFDGNFIIGGHSELNPSKVVYVAKINILGDTLWTKTFATVNTGFDVGAYGVTELTDQQILVTGIGYVDNGLYYKAIHLRLDIFGNLVYLKYYGTNWYRGIDVISTSNGGYIISSDFGMCLSKFDNIGASVWTKFYHNYYYAGGYQEGNLSGRLAKLYGGRMLFVGTAFLLNGTKDLYILKLDSNGVAYSGVNPVITATGPTVVCVGDSVVLTAPLGYTSYQWLKANLSAQKTYFTVNSPTFVAKETGGYMCVMTKSTGTRVTPYLSVTVNELPNTAINSGSTNFCAASGGTVTLSATAGYSAYQWYNGGVSISGATSATYSTSSSGNYTVSITNSCGVSTSTIKTVNSSQSPAVTVSCTGNNCYVNPCNYGDDLQATDNGSGAIYKWYNGTSLVSSGPSYTYQPFSGGNYTCMVTTACGSSTSSPYTVYQSTNIPNNYITTTSPTTGCAVVPPVTLTAPTVGSSNCQWYLNAIAITGATASSYQAMTSGSYTVHYPNSSCASLWAMSDPLTVQFDTNTVASISAPNGTTICSGTLPLTVNIIGPGASYQWYKDNVALSASTSTYQALVSGNYYCRVYRTSCGYQNTNTISMVIGAPFTNSNVASATFCAGSTYYIAVTNSINNTYQWYLGAISINGATSSSYGATQPGVYTCIATNACSSITSAPITLNQITITTPQITTSGNTNLCPGTNCTLTTPLITGGYYYWYKGNSTIQQGANLNTYSASAAGDYNVRISGTNGCYSSYSPIATITSSVFPTALTPVLTDYPLICYGSPLTIKAKANANASYSWYKDNLVIVGAIDSFYTATSGGNYNYVVSNVCGSTTSGIANIVSKAKPSAVLTALGNTSFCNGDSVVLQASIATLNSYVWYKNTLPIVAASSDIYSAKQAGNYSTKITNKYGCNKTTNTITVTVPCRGTDDSELPEGSLNSLTIYPNPSHDNIYFELSVVNYEREVNVSIYDTQGRLVDASLSKVDNGRWMLSNLESGMYILKVADEEMNISKSFVIMK